MRRVHSLPISQLETMTLSYIPLIAVTYFFWWAKPKDIMNPTVINLPSMLPGQMTAFKSMAVSSLFDSEGIEQQDSLRTIWYLTPRVFEKEAEDRALQKAQLRTSREAKRMTAQAAHGEAALKEAKQAAIREIESGESVNVEESVLMRNLHIASPKEIVLGYWDPELYHSKILWPVICLFAASFGALHLISWNTVFPTVIEQWLWRAAALSSIVSMLIFIHFEKVVVRWGGPLTIISLLSPALYILSRIVMIGGVIAAFRASDLAIYNTYIVSNYWIHVL